MTRVSGSGALTARARRRDRRRGFTFMELLTVVTIVGIGIWIAASITSGQSSYYYLRGDAERITAALQRAAVQSASRGELANAVPPVTAGVSFFTGRYFSSAYQNVGFSLCPWFENDPLFPIPRPAVPISDVGGTTALTRNHVRTLQQETLLFRDFPANQPLADQAFFRYRAGRLDVFNPNGSQGGAHLGELNASFRAVPSNLPAPGLTVAWTFDIVNVNCGWIRMRASSGGFVESSGISPLGAAVATTQTGGFFE